MIGLTPNTTYYYRLHTWNATGERNGAINSFKTTYNPAATANAPTNVGPTSATLNGVVNPEGYATEYVFKYWPAGHPTEASYIPVPNENVGSGASNVAVHQTLTNLSREAAYEYEIVATNAGGASHSAVLAVHTGRAMTSQTAPVPTENVAEALGVSCATATSCVEVGERSATTFPDPKRPFADIWNGKAWVASEPPMPSGPTEAFLRGVSCPAENSCYAVGETVGESGQEGPLVEHWNGSTWTIETLPQLAGGKARDLMSISCATTTTCLAVGQTTGTGPLLVGARLHNGTWEAAEPTTPKEETVDRVGVSCPTISHCDLAFSAQLANGREYLVGEQWSEGQWTLQPAGAGEFRLFGFSCANVSSCQAVGERENNAIEAGWNGTSWTFEPSMKAASEHAYPEAVSCVATNYCLASGWQDYPGAIKPLLETWNGTEWYETPVPTTAETEDWFLHGVSCTSVVTCMTVGQAKSSVTGLYLPSSANFVLQPPSVEAGEVQESTYPEPQLTGAANPEGQATAYHFEYGTSTAYGTSVPIPSSNVGAGTERVAVSERLKGLPWLTTYHYRIVATNYAGTSYGSDHTFVTGEGPPAVLTAPSISPAEANQGVKLTSTSGSWSHKPTSYLFQWLSCNAWGEGCLPISGATGTVYTPLESQVGETLRVQVTASNVDGATTTQSAATPPVLPPPPENTVLPAISESHTSGWSAAHAIDTGHSLAGASCPSTGFCVAVDNAGNILTTTNSGSTWSTTAISGAPVFTAVSCSPGTTATSGLCMAVTNGQTAYLANNPTGGAGSWASTTTYTAGSHLSVSCATTSFCISTTSGQTNIAAVSGTTATWTDSSANAVEFKSDSCTSTTFCLHVDSGKGIDYSTKPTEAAGWGTFVATGLVSNAVSCAPGTTSTSGLCVDVGASGTISTATNPSGTWTTANIDGTNTLTSVSCAATTFCAAVDNNGNVLTSTNPTAAASWVKTNVDSTYTINGVNCPSASFCAAVDSQGRALVSSNPTGGAGSWKLEAGDPGVSLTGVSCTSSTFCAAVDNVGHILVYTGSTGATLAATAGIWTNEPTSYAYQWQRCNTAGGECVNVTGATNTTYALTSADIGHAIRVVVTATNSGGSNSATSAATSVIEGLKHTTQTIDSGTSLNAASCMPATSDCVVSDGKGNALYTTNASATSAGLWNAWTGPSSNPSEAVACPTTSLCTLADGGSLYWSSSLGGAWTLAFTPSYHVVALTCASSSFCVDGQGENGGYIRYSTNPGSTSWNAELIGGAVTMNGVFCLSSSFCTAVDSTGNLHVATSAAQIESASWTNTDVNGAAALTGISCTSTTSCVAVDGTGDIFSLAITGAGAATATKHNIDGTNSFTAIACTANATCAAVDNQGNVFLSTNGGETWTKQYQLSVDLTSVSCASDSLCVTVDTTGDVTAFEA